MALSSDVLAADVEFLIEQAKENHPDDLALVSGLERLLRALQPEPVRPQVVEDVNEAW